MGFSSCGVRAQLHVGSFQTRDRVHVPCLPGGVLTIGLPGKSLKKKKPLKKKKAFNLSVMSLSGHAESGCMASPRLWQASSLVVGHRLRSLAKLP